MKVLNNPIFPAHVNTYQGIASDEVMTDKPYQVVHADAGGTITVEFESGTLILTLGTGEDVSVAGAITVSSTVSVKIS